LLSAIHVPSGRRRRIAESSPADAPIARRTSDKDPGDEEDDKIVSVASSLSLSPSLPLPPPLPPPPPPPPPLDE
jgi:hypothetical protein